MSCTHNSKDDARTARRVKRLFKLKLRRLEKRILDRGREKRPSALIAELRRDIEALAGATQATRSLSPPRRTRTRGA